MSLTAYQFIRTINKFKLFLILGQSLNTFDIISRMSDPQEIIHQQVNQSKTYPTSAIHIEEIVDSSHTVEEISFSPSKKTYESPSKVNHIEIGKFADASMIASNELGEGIKLSIVGNQLRGSAFMKYTVYHIVGEDKKGQIDVYRRYNQFYKMRTAIVKRFPGCFVPSIPDKAITLKDDELVRKRQRYLNDFIKKVSKLSHIYNSQQFQALLRSTEKDLSSTFQKWPNPSATDIINKYKQNFSQLGGKLITTELRTQIHDFTKLITQTDVYTYKFKIQVKELAQARDRLDKNYPILFEKCFPNFQRECLSDLTNQQGLICTNPSEAKFLEHQVIAKQSMSLNPYWLLYDLIKHEERDGKAFLESVKAIQDYQNKKYELDIKITQNNKTISEINLGKKSNSEQKFKLQIENQTLKKEKESVELLTDIIIALVAFLEINRFKKQKALFYENVLKKIGGYQINQVQNMAEIWKDWNIRTHHLCQVIHDI